MIRLLEIPKLLQIPKLWNPRPRYSNSLGTRKAFKADTGVNDAPLSERVTPAGPTKLKREVAAAYLRAAQAYMLISIPTGTSTIFGVFQAILALLAGSDAFRPREIN
jgi:hypothetical protein